jgi:hypothetical protein
MPDRVKEKLVEVLNNSFEKQYEKRGLLTAQHTATDLIANGVTVQEWISVKDRLPEKDGRYLCNYHFGEYPKMTFAQVLDYYATDIVPHFQHTLGDGSMKVTHWMEIPQLPQPPKGE